MELLCVTWRKSVRKIWKISPHCNLQHHINSYDPIDNIIKKRCITCIYNLMNCDTTLLNRTIKHSLSMSSTILDENIGYCMFKYGIYMCERYGHNSVFYGKIQNDILSETSIINIYSCITI